MKTSRELHKFSGKMRRNLTTSENYVLRQIETLNISVKTQMILGFYIMDFILPTKMINIEIDGDVHRDKVRYDFLRDKFTTECGFSVIRIKNNDIYNYNYSSLLESPDVDNKFFRSALAMGNCIRGKAILKERKKMNETTNEKAI